MTKHDLHPLFVLTYRLVIWLWSSRERASLEDVRSCDFRDVYFACPALGKGLPVIGKLLGHT